MTEMPISDGKFTSTGRADAVAALGPGSILGRYEILLSIAAGGMGQVWAARQRGLHGFRKIVALKTTLAKIADSSNFEKLFLDEARLASHIQHPNVCNVLELGDESGVLYLAMEWVGGCSLTQLLAAMPGKRLDPRVAARIVAQACAGLHAAHELRDDSGARLDVIHRDVSPQNLLITPEGHVKVADFGIAKARHQLHEATTTGEVKGKIAFMSPEQYIGKHYDHRIDIYALGCVLYQATVGAKAFSGEDMGVIYRILESDYTRPRTLFPEFPAELEDIIVRAMAKHPEDRYPTAQAMREALDDWLDRSGPAIDESDVAKVLGEHMGETIQRRQATLREASLASDAGHTPAPPVPRRGTNPDNIDTTRPPRMNSAPDLMTRSEITSSSAYAVAVEPLPRGSVAASSVPDTVQSTLRSPIPARLAPRVRAPVAIAAALATVSLLVFAGYVGTSSTAPARIPAVATPAAAAPSKFDDEPRRDGLRPDPTARDAVRDADRDADRDAAHDEPPTAGPAASAAAVPTDDAKSGPRTRRAAAAKLPRVVASTAPSAPPDTTMHPPTQKPRRTLDPSDPLAE